MRALLLLFITLGAIGFHGASLGNVAKARLVRLDIHPAALAVSKSLGRVFVAGTLSGKNFGSGAEVDAIDEATGRIVAKTRLNGLSTRISMVLDTAGNRVIVVGRTTAAGPIVDTISAASGRLIRSVHISVAARPQRPGTSSDIVVNDLLVDGGRQHAFILVHSSINGHNDNSVFVLDTRTYRVIDRIALGAQAVPVTGLLDGVQGRLYVAAVGSDRVYTIGLDTDRLLGSWRAAKNPCGLALDNTHHMLLVEGSAPPSSISEIRTLGRALPKSLSLGIRVPAVQPCPLSVTEVVGQAFIVGQGDARASGAATNGTITILDIAGFRVLKAAVAGIAPLAIANTASREYVANWGTPTGSGSVSVFSSADGTRISNFAVPGHPSALAVDMQVNRLVLAISKSTGTSATPAGTTAGAVLIMQI